MSPSMSTPCMLIAPSNHLSSALALVQLPNNFSSAPQRLISLATLFLKTQEVIQQIEVDYYLLADKHLHQAIASSLNTTTLPRSIQQDALSPVEYIHPADTTPPDPSLDDMDMPQASGWQNSDLTGLTTALHTPGYTLSQVDGEPHNETYHAVDFYEQQGVPGDTSSVAGPSNMQGVSTVSPKKKFRVWNWPDLAGIIGEFVTGDLKTFIHALSAPVAPRKTTKIPGQNKQVCEDEVWGKYCDVVNRAVSGAMNHYWMIIHTYFHIGTVYGVSASQEQLRDTFLLAAYIHEQIQRDLSTHGGNIGNFDVEDASYWFGNCSQDHPGWFACIHDRMRHYTPDKRFITSLSESQLPNGQISTPCFDFIVGYPDRQTIPYHIPSSTSAPASVHQNMSSAPTTSSASARPPRALGSAAPRRPIVPLPRKANSATRQNSITAPPSSTQSQQPSADLMWGLPQAGGGYTMAPTSALGGQFEIRREMGVMHRGNENLQKRMQKVLNEYHEHQTIEKMMRVVHARKDLAEFYARNQRDERDSMLDYMIKARTSGIGGEAARAAEDLEVQKTIGKPIDLKDTMQLIEKFLEVPSDPTILRLDLEAGPENQAAPGHVPTSSTNRPLYPPRGVGG